MFTSNLRISSTTDTVVVDDWSPFVCSPEDWVSLEDRVSLVLSLDDRASLAPPRSLEEPTPLSPVLSSQTPLLPSDSPDSAHIRGLGVGEGALASESLPDGNMM